jgi:hypothetical protein
MIRGIVSGEVLTIVAPETSLRSEDYPAGQVIALTDPSTSLVN